MIFESHILHAMESFDELIGRYSGLYPADAEAFSRMRNEISKECRWKFADYTIGSIIEDCNVLFGEPFQLSEHGDENEQWNTKYFKFRHEARAALKSMK